MVIAGRIVPLTLAGFALLPATPVVAQTPVVPAPTREEVNRVPVGPDTRAPSRLTVDGGIERAPCPLADQRFAGVTVAISEVVFDNLRAVSPEQLRPTYADYVGKTVPIATVCEIRDRASTLLRQMGYLAAVQVPAQRIENGIVRFDVLMAKLVAVQVRGDAGRSEQLIAGYLNRLTRQEAFNEREAARYLLLARDIPGYDVRLTLRPAGGAPGEVVGEVAVVRQPLSVDLNIQNYGSNEVGRFGGLLRGEFYDLLGLGDRLTLGYFTTADFDEQHVLQGGYDLRLGSEGLTLGTRATYAWTNPDPAGAAARVRARTFVASGELSYPFVRAQASNLRGAFGLEFIDQTVRLDPDAGASFRLSRDELRVLYARLDFDAIDQGSIGSLTGFSSAEPRWRAAGSLELRKGLDIFGASGGCGAPPYAACTGSNVSLSRIEGRPQAGLVRFAGLAEYRPVPKITFALAPRAQYSRRALVSYEEFSAGNYTVGRGYDPGTIIGDSGVGFAAELRFGRGIPESRDAFAIQPYAFFDAAWVWNRRSPALPDEQKLSSAGGGARISYGDLGRLDLTLAVPTRRAGGQLRRGDARLLMTFTTKLLPWTR